MRLGRHIEGAVVGSAQSNAVILRTQRAVLQGNSRGERATGSSLPYLSACMRGLQLPAWLPYTSPATVGLRHTYANSYLPQAIHACMHAHLITRPADRYVLS